jgi:hypothetical protein
MAGYTHCVAGLTPSDCGGVPPMPGKTRVRNLGTSPLEALLLLSHACSLHTLAFHVWVGTRGLTMGTPMDCGSVPAMLGKPPCV